ncbi:hypothetical protein B0H17DRAFT_253162 [Mycena rosella]|uniref:Uncharacterized protein n=1 Tax=Mycena rosella TaxID=1033263 RepID=A0AAD7DV45_MYCRO|nr:hypothetical protein B0H17DRAFT_253162 [Mycena rosella]
MNILCAIAYFPDRFSPCNIDQLLELEPGDADLALRSLHSLVNLECHDIVWHHASFGDFLCDASRAGKFFVGELASRMDLARSVLNALSSLDLAHDATWLIGRYWIKYVVKSVPPSAALLPLIRSINPVFLRLEPMEQNKIIEWFQAIHPVPDDLIQLWEDYVFMDDLSFDWYMVDSTPSLDRAALPIQECREAISKSPGLQRILYATQFLSPEGSFCFFKVVLDSMPWDDVRSLICPLRDVIGEPSHGEVRKLWSSFIFTERAKHLQWATEDKAMAHRCLQLLKDVGSRQLNVQFWYGTCPAWGLLIRITPPCLDLLQEIREFEPPFWLWDGNHLRPIEIHNVVQWLKTFPELPLDVIQLWEGYFLKVYRLTLTGLWEGEKILKEDMERQNREYSFNDSFDSVPHLRRLSEEWGFTTEVPT